MKKIKKFVDEVISEVKKVVWPKRDVLWSATILVILISAFFGVMLGVFDRVFVLLINIIL